MVRTRAPFVDSSATCIVRIVRIVARSLQRVRAHGPLERAIDRAYRAHGMIHTPERELTRSEEKRRAKCDVW